MKLNKATITIKHEIITDLRNEILRISYLGGKESMELHGRTLIASVYNHLERFKFEMRILLGEGEELDFSGLGEWGYNLKACLDWINNEFKWINAIHTIINCETCNGFEDFDKNELEHISRVCEMSELDNFAELIYKRNFIAGFIVKALKLKEYPELIENIGFIMENNT